MYTGIIDHCGIIQAIEKLQRSNRLTVVCDFVDLEEGESVSVDGFCVTIIEPKEKLFCCELSPETLSKTVAIFYQIGTKVNLERALKVGGRLGGHFVSGHIDQIGRIVAKEIHDDFVKMTIVGIEEAAMSYLTHKGSITVNGVSLTVNKLLPNGFETMLIPHTLVRTNLVDLSAGDLVNLEFDMLAKMVARQLVCDTEEEN